MTWVGGVIDWFRRRRSLQIVSPADLVDGERGSVEGVVVADGPLLLSPLTATPCVYWQLRLREVGVYDHVERGRAEGPGGFVLDHPRGQVRVVASTVVMLIAPHRVVDAGRLDRTWRTPEERLIRDQATVLRVEFAWASSTLGAAEYVVTPGMRVAVRGYCAREPDPTAAGDVAGYREALPTRPVLSGTRRAPLLIVTPS